MSLQQIEQWTRSFDQALEEARTSRKDILVDFTAAPM
jgi:hypothetical protein